METKRPDTEGQWHSGASTRSPPRAWQSCLWPYVNDRLKAGFPKSFFEIPAGFLLLEGPDSRFKAKWGRDSGLKLYNGWESAKLTIGITGWRHMDSYLRPVIGQIFTMFEKTYNLVLIKFNLAYTFYAWIPETFVTVALAASRLNFKDGLGRGAIIKQQYPTTVFSQIHWSLKTLFRLSRVLSDL